MGGSGKRKDFTPRGSSTGSEAGDRVATAFGCSVCVNTGRIRDLDCACKSQTKLKCPDGGAAQE